MLGKVTSLLIILLVLAIGISNAQQNKRYVVKKAAVVTGMENSGVPTTSFNTKSNLLPTSAKVGDLTFTYYPTNLWTGYDLQSNGVPQEIWIDPTRPENVHAVFMWSSQLSGFTDRTIQYLVSFDGGLTFTNAGQVPPSGNRSGYGSIDGFSDGFAVVACHTFLSGETSTVTRSLVFKDDDIGAGTFSQVLGDPGYVTGHYRIWPRVAVINDNNVAIASSENTTSDSVYLDFYTSTNGWAGWQSRPGDQAETYAWAVTDDGSTAGIVYSGNANLFGNVYYMQTTDFGATWEGPTQIWQTTLNHDSVDMGMLRGCDLVFLSDGTPCATFEVCGVTATGLYANYPSSIYFWNPSVNGGVAFPVADTSTVPFNTHWYYTSPSNTIGAYVPICRPTIGRSMTKDGLFIAFIATTPFFYGDTTTNNVESYYAGWFTSSIDSGKTWSAPVKFTQDEYDGHLQDYRFISLAPKSPVVGDTMCTVHMVVQADSIPGDQVTPPTAFTAKISATMYDITTQVQVFFPAPSGVRDQNTIYSYALQQNYPNPFNPSTMIKYSLAKRSNVLLKVYNMLGQEVATVVNSQQEAGDHSINFNASKLASGLYIYKLQAGNFTESKKMMLLK